jgi:hypothetical protein
MKHMPPRYIRKVCRKLAAKAGRKGIEGYRPYFMLRTTAGLLFMRSV